MGRPGPGSPAGSISSARSRSRRASTSAPRFFINALLNLQFGLSTKHWVTILIYAIVLLLHGLLNQFGIRLVAMLNDVSVWWHILGVLVIVAVLTFVPSHHQSAQFVFTSTYNNTGWHSIFYVLLIGLLLAQYTFTGYDASAHMTEETHKPPGAARVAS